MHAAQTASLALTSIVPPDNARARGGLQERRGLAAADVWVVATSVAGRVPSQVTATPRGTNGLVFYRAPSVLQMQLRPHRLTVGEANRFEFRPPSAQGS